MVGQSQVFVLIVILVIGIVFGAGVAWWILARRKPGEPQAEPRPAPDELAALRERYAEEAGLWHEKTSGKLVVRFEKQMLEKTGQLNSMQRTHMEALAKEWLAWLGVEMAPRPAPAPVQPAIILPPPAAAAATPAQRVQRPQAPLPVSDAIPVSSTPAKIKSIVEQIDEILQDKLARSSSIQKGVRLAEDAAHGVVVWIGLEHYNGVDLVTDPEVRALLREAAEEWERRATSAKK